MKPYNAGKDMWLRAQITHQKLKHNARKQDTDGIQALSVLYMTRLEAIYQQ